MVAIEQAPQQNNPVYDNIQTEILTQVEGVAKYSAVKR